MNTSQRIDVMSIQITNITEVDGVLSFNIKNVDTCVVNAIRRTVLSNISTLVFRGFPYENSNINMVKNTSNFNNEYMKQRISCIPVMNDDRETYDAFRENYKVVVNVENNTHRKMYVTTEDIEIVLKSSENENGDVKKLSRDKVMKYFPPDPVLPANATSSPYILLCVLFPNQSGDESQNEALHFECDFDIGCAKENSCWNVVHNCTYEFLRNEAKIAEMADKIGDESERTDFLLLDAERYYHENEYKMTFETLGTYSNNQLVNESCDYIMKKLKLVENILREQTQSKILTSDVVTENATDGTALKEDIIKLQEKYCHLYREGNLYILKLKEDDYTIGKLIENYFYKVNEDKLQFVGFKKEHPIKSEAFIHFQYRKSFLANDANSSDVIAPLINTIMMISDVYQEIKKAF